MNEFLMALGASFVVSSISLVGIFVLLKSFTKESPLVTILISFAAGVLLGDVFLHLLPEQIETYGYGINTIVFIFVGILFMLIVEAYFHCSHDSSKEMEHDHKHLGKINIIGDALHNFLDGIAIGASFLVNPAVGIASTIAIILHEIPQELADTAVLVYSGWSKKKVVLINLLTALTAVAGVIVVFGVEGIVDNAEQYLVPIAIGQFIYIALADLVPEIHKNKTVSKYIVEIGLFIAGLVIMYLLTLSE